MSGGPQNAVVSKVLSVGLALWLVPEPSPAESRSFEAIPVGYIVAADTESRDRVMRRIYARDLDYDQTLRTPSGADRPIPVNCKEAHWLGAVYVLRVSRALRYRPFRDRFGGSSLSVRYVWEHSELTLERLYLRHYHDVDFARHRKAALASEHLRMRKEIMVDGLLRLTASIEGEPILDVTFELTGCATPDRG